MSYEICARGNAGFFYFHLTCKIEFGILLSFVMIKISIPDFAGGKFHLKEHKT